MRIMWVFDVWLIVCQQYDAVRINMIYQQARWSMISQNVHCTDEEVIFFAALQVDNFYICVLNVTHTDWHDDVNMCRHLIVIVTAWADTIISCCMLDVLSGVCQTTSTTTQRQCHRFACRRRQWWCHRCTRWPSVVSWRSEQWLKTSKCNGRSNT